MKFTPHQFMWTEWFRWIIKRELKEEQIGSLKMGLENQKMRPNLWEKKLLKELSNILLMECILIWELEFLLWFLLLPPKILHLLCKVKMVFWELEIILWKEKKMLIWLMQEKKQLLLTLEPASSLHLSLLLWLEEDT